MLVRPVIAVGEPDDAAADPEDAVVIRPIIPVGEPEGPVEDEEVRDRPRRSLRQGIGDAARRRVRADGDVNITPTRNAAVDRRGGSITAGTESNGRNLRRTTQATAGWNADTGGTVGLSRTRSREGDDVGPSVASSSTAGLRWHDSQVEGQLETRGPGGRTSSSSVGANLDGVRLRHEQGRTIDREDGRSDRVSANGSADFSNGRFGGGATWQRLQGRRTVASAGGSGELDLAQDGRLEGMSGGVNGSIRGVSASASARFRVTTGDVEERDGRYAVDYTWVVGYGGGGGLSGRSRGVSVGGSASRDHAEVRTGTLSFDTRAEAELFRQRAPAHLDEYVGDADSASGAREMHEGETRTEGTSDTTAGGLTLSGGNLGVGVDASRTHEESAMVRRGAGDSVDVQVRVSDLDRMGISGQGIGINLRTGVRERREETVIVRFDLSNDAGRRAYEQYRAEGTLPSRRDGWRVVRTEDTRAQGSELSLGLFGFEGSSTGEVAESERVDNGRRRHIVRGQHDDEVSAFGRSGSRSSSFEASRERNARGRVERSWTIGAEVEGSTAAEASEAMAEVSGTNARFDHDAEASGQWSMQCQLEERDIDRFVGAVLSGRAHPDLLLGDSEAGEELRAALRSAGADRDAQARAIAAFVSETGVRGLAFVRRFSGTRQQFDVALQGDRFLRGAEARQQLEARIARYSAQVQSGGGNRAALARHIAGDLNGLRSRQAALQDPDRYEDLPDQLRQQELQRTAHWIEQLEGLRSSIPMTTTNQADAYRAAVASRRGDDGEEHAEEDRRRAARLQDIDRSLEGRIADTGVTAEMQAHVRALDRHLAHVKELLAPSRDAVQFSRRVQLDGYGAFSLFGGATAESTLGAATGNVDRMWGLFGDGPATRGYARAQRLYDQGRSRERAARQSERFADRQRAILADPTMVRRHPAAYRQLCRQLETAVACLLAAKTAYDSAEGQYQAIRRQHQGEYPGLFHGYGAR